MDLKVTNIFLIFLLGSLSFSYSEETSVEELLHDAGEMLFMLYTRKNPVDGEHFELSNIEQLRQTNFNASRTTKILIHGWKGSYLCKFGILVKNAFLIQYDTNVIVIDWAKEAKTVWYNHSRNKVAAVGHAVAYMIDEFVSKLGVNPDHIHIVGHSLGAHVAGIAGLLSTPEVGRVTGLDPAGPLFSYSDYLRLSQHSGKFVDVIHTDAYSAGFAGNLGHVDFYPNGGFAIQPGCGIDVMGTVRSHERAYWLFAESVFTPGRFKAISCKSWGNFKKNECPINSTITEMGEHVSKKARGSFYLVTGDKTPYALGESSLHYRQG